MMEGEVLFAPAARAKAGEGRGLFFLQFVPFDAAWVFSRSSHAKSSGCGVETKVHCGSASED